MKSIFYLQENDRKVLILCLFILVITIGVFIFVGNSMTETPEPFAASITTYNGYKKQP